MIERSNVVNYNHQSKIKKGAFPYENYTSTGCANIVYYIMHSYNHANVDIDFKKPRIYNIK